MTEPAKPFTLERVAAPPAGIPVLADDAPRHYWVLSNGRGWSLALGQNIGGAEPEIFAAASGVLFVGLYHGFTASVKVGDGAIIGRGTLSPGNMVFWSEHDGLVVAEGEQELGVFEAGGRFLWKAAMGDVIEEIALEGAAFRVTDAAGRTSRFEARTGKLL